MIVYGIGTYRNCDNDPVEIFRLKPGEYLTQEMVDDAMKAWQASIKPKSDLVILLEKK